jgi:regulator of cell morphogenesis and NO signaling
MFTIDLTKTISQLVWENPIFDPILQKYNIDSRFAANLLVTEVCTMRGLNLQEVVQDLEGSLRENKFLDEKVLAGYGIPELIGYILFTHHAYLEKELPRLEGLFGEAVLEDGAGHPELLELVPLFKDFKDSMLWHMQEEEKHLFPFFLLMVENNDSSPAMNEEGIQNLVRLFENEDEEIRLDLERLRDKTRNYHVPEGVGQAYRDLFHDLSRMEIELNRHVRVENQILFPKVIAAELELLRKASRTAELKISTSGGGRKGN